MAELKDVTSFAGPNGLSCSLVVVWVREAANRHDERNKRRAATVGTRGSFQRGWRVPPCIPRS